MLFVLTLLPGRIYDIGCCNLLDGLLAGVSIILSRAKLANSSVVEVQITSTMCLSSTSWAIPKLRHEAVPWPVLHEFEVTG